MIDDEDIKIYKNRIFQLNIKSYELYDFRRSIKQFVGASVELYDNGLPELHNEIDNIYFATFRTIEDARKFKELFVSRIVE